MLNERNNVKIGGFGIVLNYDEENLKKFGTNSLIGSIIKTTDKDENNNVILPSYIELIFKKEKQEKTFKYKIPYYCIPLFLKDILDLVNVGYDIEITENINSDYVITLTNNN